MEAPVSNDWKLDAAGAALLDAASKIADEVVRPAAAAVDEEARFPRETFARLKAAGLLKLISSKDVGGHGQGLRTAMAVAERLARECPATAMILIMHFGATAVIEKHGATALRRQVTDGGLLTTLAFSESGSRSHFWIPVSTATKTPQGIRLDATKQLITSAGECGLYVWSSKPAAAEGLSSIWAVPASTPGVTVGKKFNGMGLRGNSSAPLDAKGAVVPETSVLGGDGKGFDVMMGVVMPFFSLQSAAVSLGLMEGAFARTVAHVTTSQFSYDGSKIADIPQVRGHVARMRLKIDLLRGLLLDAIDAIEGGRPDAILRVLEVKVAGSETSLEVLDLAMRVCGGAAYRKDVGVERFFRDSRASTVMAPVSDALYDFIGKAVCGMPVFG
jgi:alkylation response protein AidB-like acyl-CoA dehydrogenase